MKLKTLTINRSYNTNISNYKIIINKKKKKKKKKKINFKKI